MNEFHLYPVGGTTEKVAQFETEQNLILWHNNNNLLKSNSYNQVCRLGGLPPNKFLLPPICKPNSIAWICQSSRQGATRFPFYPYSHFHHLQWHFQQPDLRTSSTALTGPSVAFGGKSPKIQSISKASDKLWQEQREGEKNRNTNSREATKPSIMSSTRTPKSA